MEKTKEKPKAYKKAIVLFLVGSNSLSVIGVGKVFRGKPFELKVEVDPKKGERIPAQFQKYDPVIHGSIDEKGFVDGVPVVPEPKEEKDKNKKTKPKPNEEKK